MKIDIDELCRRNPNLAKDLKRNMKKSTVVLYVLLATVVIGMFTIDIVNFDIVFPIVSFVPIAVGALYFLFQYMRLAEFFNQYIKSDE